MFSAAYDSPWHNPLAFFLCGGLFLAWLARRLPYLWGYAVVWTFLIVMDAVFDGTLPIYPPAVAAGPWPQRIAILFVVLGDLRVFLLIERALSLDLPRTSRVGLARAWAIPIAASLLSLPLAALLRRIYPGETGSRVVFLAYEAGFIALLLPLFWGLVLRPRAAGLSAPLRRYIDELAAFEAVQYGLWALADVIILAGNDIGFLLRFLPNVMYYGAYVPFAVLRAPAPLRPEVGR